MDRLHSPAARSELEFSLGIPKPATDKLSILSSLGTVPRGPRTDARGFTRGFECASDSLEYCTLTATIGDVFTGISYTFSCGTTPVTMTVEETQMPGPIASAYRIFMINGDALDPTSPTNGDPDPRETSDDGQSEQDTPGDSGSPTRGLSPSGRIAIGVTIPVVFLLVGLALFFYIRRDKNRARHRAIHPAAPVLDPSFKPELDASQATGYTRGYAGQYPGPESGNVPYGSTFPVSAETPISHHEVSGNSAGQMSELPTDGYRSGVYEFPHDNRASEMIGSMPTRHEL